MSALSPSEGHGGGEGQIAVVAGALLLRGALNAPATRPLGPRRLEPHGEDPVRGGHLAPYQKL